LIFFTIYGKHRVKEEDIMQDLQPSFQDWQNLYGQAIDYWKIQPWQWVNDTDLFGVKNPEDGEIGYCCVVGALGEFRGLVFYLGTEGLESYLKTQASESPEEDVLSAGKCHSNPLFPRRGDCLSFPRNVVPDFLDIFRIEFFGSLNGS
jgi:hypothetical protein